MEWKRGVLRDMGVRDYVELGLRDVILLLVHLGGEPVYGLESLHLMLFLYPYVESGERLLLAAPFSPKVEKELLWLEREGLVERRREYRGGRGVVALVETRRGAGRARALAARLRDGHVLLRGFAVRRGLDVLGELEALKETYNGLGVLEVAERLASLAVKGDERVLSAVEGAEVPALRLYAKNFLKELERLREGAHR